MSSLVDRVPVCILRYVFEFLEAHDALHNWGLCKQWRNDSRRNGEEQLLWATLLSRDAPVPMRRLLDELRKTPDSEPRSCIPRSLIKRTTDPQTGVLDVRRLYYALLYNTVVYDVVQSQYFQYYEHAAPGREIALCILLATHSYGFVQVPSQVFAIDEEYSLRAWCDPFIQMDAQVTGWQTPAAGLISKRTTPRDVAESIAYAIDRLRVIEVDLSGFASAFTSDSHVPRAFLCGCATLTTIDFGGIALAPITVGPLFSCSCAKLTSIDVSGIAGASTIPHGFLSHCLSLRSFNFSSFANVRMIGNFVLRSCISLTEVNLNGLDLLEVVGEGLLSACGHLKRVSFSHATPRVRCVGRLFLAECVQLESVDLAALANVTNIPDEFMHRCESLVEVAGLSKMTRVTRVGRNFLRECIGLQEVSLFDSRSVIDEIGDEFITRCCSLASINLSCLHATQVVGGGFLAHCTSLTHVDLSCLQSLKQIGPSFLRGCKSLRTVSLRGCRGLERIGESFLASCDSLTSVDLSGWSKLSYLAAKFLDGCVGLVELKLVGLSALEQISLDLDCHFLEGLTNLERVVIDERCTSTLCSSVQYLGSVVVCESQAENTSSSST